MRIAALSKESTPGQVWPLCCLAATPSTQQAPGHNNAASSTEQASHLVLLKVVGHDCVCTQGHLAGDGALSAHDEPQQRALAAPIGSCRADMIVRHLAQQPWRQPWW